MRFPDFYPENCPCEESSPANGEFFRLCEKNPPIPSDFAPHIVKYPNKDYIGKECEACGISVLKTIEVVVKYKRRYKHLQRLKVAKGTLEPHMGKIKQSSTGHYTWWIPQEVEPWLFFENVDL